MSISSTRSAFGIFLPLVFAVGIVSGLAAKQSVSGESTQSSPSAEVMVTINMPAGKILKGTAIVTLEDISVQDVPSVELARVTVPASTLSAINPAVVAVPIDLQLIEPNALVNVAVHIDVDDNGSFSNGDWISTSLVSVISNNKLDATVEIVEIGSE